MIVNNWSSSWTSPIGFNQEGGCNWSSSTLHVGSQNESTSISFGSAGFMVWVFLKKLVPFFSISAQYIIPPRIQKAMSIPLTSFSIFFTTFLAVRWLLILLWTILLNKTRQPPVLEETVSFCQSANFEFILFFFIFVFLLQFFYWREIPLVQQKYSIPSYFLLYSLYVDLSTNCG